MASRQENFMLELVNRERVSRDLVALTMDDRLVAAANGHSAWLLDVDRLDHIGEGGSTPRHRMVAAGFVFGSPSISGENLAMASVRGPTGLDDEVELLHRNLMASPGHRKNILQPRFRQVGIGFAIGKWRSLTAAVVTQCFAGV